MEEVIPVIKYLLFDFDGTLVDSMDMIVEVYNQVAGKYKAKKLEKKDAAFFKGLSIKERCKFLHFKLYKFPLLALDIYKLSKPHITELLFFEGIKEILEDLHVLGVKMAIISTNSENNIRVFLQQNQIDYIDEVICSNNLFGKDKEISRFLKTHQLKRSEVIYIGDEVRDITASKKNGIKVIWVSWGYDQYESVKKLLPDCIANKPYEILEYVQKLS